jgi:site-specific recombinase XerD
MRLLNAAAGNSRDYAILQLFLQTGIRVAELVGLSLSDIDLEAGTMLVNGKGNKQRTIYLEKKATQALRAQYISLKPKRGKKQTRKLRSGILPEKGKTTARSFRCTDYGKWTSMTRSVNR